MSHRFDKALSGTTYGIYNECDRTHSFWLVLEGKDTFYRDFALFPIAATYDRLIYKLDAHAWCTYYGSRPNWSDPQKHTCQIPRWQLVARFT